MPKFVVSGCVKQAFGSDPLHAPEAEYYMTDDNDSVIVGMGYRVHDDNVTTMHLLYGQVDDKG